MTGKELIMYILQNNLENEEFFINGKIPGLISMEQAAAKYEVGVSTVLTWFHRGKLPGCKIENTIYIFDNAKDPRTIRLGGRYV